MSEGERPAEAAASLTHATIAGVRWISLARIAGEVLAVVSMVALARLIGPKEFGDFAIVLVVTEIALTIPGEGIGTALVQRKEVGDEHLRAATFMSLCLGVGLGAVALVVAPLIFRPVFGEPTAQLVRLAIPIFPLAGLTAVPLAIAQRRLDFRLISVSQIASTIVRALVSVALALGGLNASALIIGTLAGSAASMLVLVRSTGFPAPVPHRRAMRELVGFGVPAALSGLSWTGFRNSDFAIVGARLGPTAAGVYWRAFQLAIEYQRKIGSGVHQVSFPIYSRATDQESMFALRRRVARVVSAVLIPGLALLAVLAPTLVPWLFGSAWRSAVVPTQILCFAGVLTVPADTMGAIVLANGRARGWLAYHLACFATYASAILVASGYGLNAVCVAVVGVQLLGTLAAYGLLLRGLVERPLLRLWEDISPGCASALGVAAAAAPVSWALDGGAVPTPVRLLVVSAVAVLAALGTLRLASRETWTDVRQLVARVTGRRRGAKPTPQVSLAG